MGAKTKSILFPLILLSFTAGMSRQAIAGSEPLQTKTPSLPTMGLSSDTKKLPSTEEVLKMVKQNLCAPTIDSKKKNGSNAQLEATACADCAKASVTQSTGLTGTVEKVRSLFAPLKAEENKALIKRDLTFWKSKYGPMMTSYYGSMSPSTEQQLTSLKAGLKGYIEAKEEYPKKAEKFKDKTAALENAASGQDLSESEKAIIKKQLEMNLQSHQSSINSANQTIESIKKLMETNSVQAEVYKPSLVSYETMLKAAVEKSELTKKALDGSKEKDVLALYSQMLNSHKEMSSFNIGSPNQYDSSIASYEKQIEALEKKLVEEKAKAASEKPESATNTDESELAKAEEKVLSSLTNLVARDEFKACGMTVAEAAMLRYYTGPGYMSLNEALRSGGEGAAEAKIAVEVLNSALRKLNRYKGAVKRGTTLPKEKLDEYQVGKIISFPAYTSTSLSYGWGGNAKFVIHTKTGRYVGVHSSHPGEDEVLLAPGTKFKVIDRKETNGNVEFVLDEIDPKIRPKAKD